jgi:hypothetical protein
VISRVSRAGKKNSSISLFLKWLPRSLKCFNCELIEDFDNEEILNPI